MKYLFQPQKYETGRKKCKYMEAKLHAKQPMGQWRNQRGNKKILGNNQSRNIIVQNL